MTEKPVVFISYARSDVELAYQITEVLERGGHRPWIDHQLIPGQRWKEKVEEAIREADVFLLVMSSKSLASQYCQWEYAMAVALGKPVLPVLIEKVPKPYPSDIADIRDIHYLDLSNGIDVTVAAMLVGSIFQARPVTRDNDDVVDTTAPTNPPLGMVETDDMSMTIEHPRVNTTRRPDVTEPLTRLPVPNENMLPQGIKAVVKVVKTDSLEPGEHLLHNTTFTVGRSQTMNLYIPEPRISKHHLTIYLANTRFYIVDYSSNGTWLNGEQIHNNLPAGLRADFDHRIDLARNNTLIHFRYSVDEN